MAVINNQLSTKLVLKVKTGVDESGSDVIASLGFNNIKTAAVDADIFAIGQQIGGLLSMPVVSIVRQNISELVNQA